MTTGHTIKTLLYGGRAYYVNGKLHREDGPAIERKRLLRQNF